MLRKARISDMASIHQLVNTCATKGEMLPRSLAELYDNIRDYYVFADEGSGTIAGACALHVCWKDLAEVRSLAVAEGMRRRGVGKSLVAACLDEAKEFGINTVFVLTYRNDLFGKLGFREVEKTELPQKIWTDCVKCPKFPVCDEIAMITRLDS